MNKILRLLVCLGVLLTGVAFVVFSIIALKAPKAEMVQIEATIVEIVEEPNFDETDYHVFVDYTVDGVTYSHKELGSYSSKMKVGDKTEIMYDAADPEHIQSKGAEKIPYVTLAVGIIAILVSLVMGFKVIVRP